VSDLTRITDLGPRRDLLESAADSQVGDLVVDLGDVLDRARRRRTRRHRHVRRLSAVLLVAAAFGIFLLVTVLDTGRTMPPETQDDRAPDAVIVWEPSTGTGTATPVPWSRMP
jgi:hypothetical protein